MAALDFPSSPTTNQVYTANGRSWKYDGTSWQSYTLVPKALMLFCSGQPANSEIIGGAIAPYAMTIANNNCIAKAANASTASSILTIYNNGSSIGTITFSTSNTGTFAITTSTVSANDNLWVSAPSDASTAAKNISIIIKE